MALARLSLPFMCHRRKGDMVVINSGKSMICGIYLKMLNGGVEERLKKATDIMTTIFNARLQKPLTKEEMYFMRDELKDVAHAVKKRPSQAVDDTSHDAKTTDTTEKTKTQKKAATANASTPDAEKVVLES